MCPLRAGHVDVGRGAATLVKDRPEEVCAIGPYLIASMSHIRVAPAAVLCVAFETIDTRTRKIFSAFSHMGADGELLTSSRQVLGSLCLKSQE